MWKKATQTERRNRETRIITESRDSKKIGAGMFPAFTNGCAEVTDVAAAGIQNHIGTAPDLMLEEMCAS